MHRKEGGIKGIKRGNCFFIIKSSLYSPFSSSNKKREKKAVHFFVNSELVHFLDMGKIALCKKLLRNASYNIFVQYIAKISYIKIQKRATDFFTSGIAYLTLRGGVGDL